MHLKHSLHHHSHSLVLRNARFLLFYVIQLYFRWLIQSPIYHHTLTFSLSFCQIKARKLRYHPYQIELNRPQAAWPEPLVSTTIVRCAFSYGANYFTIITLIVIKPLCASRTFHLWLGDWLRLAPLSVPLDNFALRCTLMPRRQIFPCLCHLI